MKDGPLVENKAYQDGWRSGPDSRAQAVPRWVELRWETQHDQTR